MDSEKLGIDSLTNGSVDDSEQESPAEKSLGRGVKRALEDSDSTNTEKMRKENETVDDTVARKADLDKEYNIEKEKSMTSEDYAVKLGLVPTDSSISVSKVREADRSPLMVPLNIGWTREMVHRNNSTRVDVRYHTPEGKRKSSFGEVMVYLKETGSPLTSENFSFIAKSICADDPEKETVRHAYSMPTGQKKSLGSPKKQISKEKPPRRRKSTQFSPLIVKLPLPTSRKSKRPSLETINTPLHSPLSKLLPADPGKRKKKTPQRDSSTSETKSPVSKSNVCEPELETSSASKAPVADISRFLIPLNMGWLREVVCRSNSKRVDIYYRSPSGKKLRSSVEVERALKEMNSTLTVENFTFKMSSIGVNDPTKETIRTSAQSVVQKIAAKSPIKKISKERSRLSLPLPPKRKTKTSSHLIVKLPSSTIRKSGKRSLDTKNTPPTTPLKSHTVNSAKKKTLPAQKTPPNRKTKSKSKPTPKSPSASEFILCKPELLSKYAHANVVYEFYSA